MDQSRNPARARLAQGGLALGMGVRFARTAEIARMMRAAGYDWLFIGEMWDTEALAADCATDGRYEFWLTAAPIPVTGAVGAPVNPIAVKLPRSSSCPASVTS